MTDRLQSRWLPWLAFTLLAAVAMWLILHAGRGLFFFGDEWAVILHRRGVTPFTILHPHNEHVIAIPVVVYKGLLQVFGMSSYTPFRVTVVLFHIVTCLALYAYARPRLGGPLRPERV